jgi:hypothetical protein
MKTLFLSFTLLVFYTFSIAQPGISTQWQKCYGGSLYEEIKGVNGSRQTSDGGFIMVGGSESFDGDVTGYHGGYDYWVVKTDQSGTIEWQKCYGGSDTDIAASVQQTDDGGYIIGGTSKSTNGNVTGNHGNADYWVIKTDPSGNIQWQKSYGGSEWEELFCITQTTDGGYIMTGFTGSFGGQVVGNHGRGDIWTVKINANGVIQWSRCYGGSEGDEGRCIQQVSDGGYIIAGWTLSNDDDVSGLHGSYDYWIIKISGSGDIQWQKCYGGSYWDEAHSIIQTSDGGYIFAGWSSSFNGDVTSNHGQADYWVVKIDPLGVIEWEKSYGGSYEDIANCIVQTNDGGYIIAGGSNSYDGDVTVNHGNKDAWLVKTDPSGLIQWQQSFGGQAYDLAYCIQQTSDGTYFTTGYTGDQPSALPGNHGNNDYYAIKLCYPDPLSVSISNPVYCISTTLTASDGFASYYWNTGETTQSIEITSGGNYQVQATNTTGCPSIYQIAVPDPIPPYGGDPISISISNSAFCHSTTLTASGGFDTYLWNTGQTFQNIDVTDGGIYSVVATNALGCTSRAEIFVSGPMEPFNGEQICLTTIDPQIKKNVIVIEKTLNVGSDSIYIYRKGSPNDTFTRIGALDIDSISTFTDESSNPYSQIYEYSISVKDSCGNESEQSGIHRTMLLLYTIGINNEVILYWNPYEGYAYQDFEIYRSNQGGAFMLIAKIPFTTYTFTDNTPPSGINVYQVRILKETPCLPTKATFAYSYSNTIQTGTDGINEDQHQQFVIFPNPANDKLTIKTNRELINETYTISDPTGRIVISGKLTSEISNLDISGLSPGSYILVFGEKNKSPYKLLKK